MSNMLVKFESKSNRVKGLSFHPKRPWVLASLHNGMIQLWDYRMETMIDKFEEHDGPVRGICFHHTQPLFVSGGDDYKIKVWNYQLKRCLFNLLGHLDYIRTVQFHHEYPWILSASDDQTIRIWNWQSRQCLSVLTGHNHYVMCAQFHVKDDLIVSASLDMTVRVWDISGLRQKNVSVANDFSNPRNIPGGGGQGAGGADLFGGTDVVVKHVLEGHSRGVNWASFHRTMPLIVSGADDREVKLWRMNELRAWEVETMRGHINNVSCVIFHPKKDLIISNSEDKTIRVWDMSKQQGPYTQRRENDRYWILDAHPTLNLLGAGHDSGLMVFKLNRERPPMDVSRKKVYYYKDLYVREYDTKTGKDTPLLSTRIDGRRGTDQSRSLCYNVGNRTQHCMLVFSDADGGTYDLFVLNKNSSGRDDAQSMKGFCRSGAFVARNRFAILDKNRQVWLKDLKNETKRKVAIPNLYINHIFPASVGRLLFRTNEGMVLYDMQVLKVINQLTITSRHPIKYVVWSAAYKNCAMFSKANIYLTDGNLVERCQITDNTRIKSGVWDASGVFIYTTSTHIKYLLPNGDSGIIRTLDTPVYLTAVSGNTVYYVDREVKTGVLQIDPTEYSFKIALVKRKYKEVLRIMKTNKLVGQSIIAYLEKKGFPEVALHFVQDPKIKFTLALECGNIRVALECAQQLNLPECWHRLGVEALRQGNHQVVEAAYQKTKNLERLSFLYLITGNIDKLGKMLQIANMKHDVMGRFHNALYLGDVEERFRVLKETGHLGLALAVARAHGLTEEAAALEAEAGEKMPPVPDMTGVKLILPPIPILKEANWPLLELSKGYFDGPEPTGGDSGPEEASDEESEADGVFNVKKPDRKDKEEAKDDFFADESEAAPAKAEETEVAAGSAWGPNDDMLAELGISTTSSSAAAGGDATDEAKDGGDDFVMPLEGKSALQKWADSHLAAQAAAAGAFDIAMDRLNRQIGVVNFTPLKPAFISLFNSARVLMPGAPGSEPFTLPLERPDGQPFTLFKLEHCVERLKTAFKAFTDGKLEETQENLTGILHTIPLVVVETKSQESELKELIGICREYMTAVRLELERRAVADPVRQCALAAYFTQCKIQPIHLILGLKVAIKAAFSIQNFKTAGTFCRRILELCVSSNKAAITKVVNVQQIRDVLKVCEEKNTEAKDIDYKDNVAYHLCCASFTPIHKTKQFSLCPYCKSAYNVSFDESVCKTCNLSRVGTEGQGLTCLAEKTRD